MSEATDLTVIEIKPDQAPALYKSGGLDDYLEQIRQLSQEIPDVTTKKGRDRIGSLARAVGSSKKAIEEPGRAYLKHLKEAVKPAEEELRRFTRECDVIRDAILKPRDEWEAEQERIRVEEAWNAMHDEALVMNKMFDDHRAAQIEAAHEMALLMNDAFDRDAKAKAEEAERRRIAHEEELKRQAAEQAKREAEEKAAAEVAAAQKREADAIAAKAQAELLAKQAKERAEQEAKEAAERAEREKQEAIAAEQRKAQESADKVRREAEAKEAARLAEEKRVADEAVKRAANVAHQKRINNEAKDDFVKGGIPEEFARKAVELLAKRQVRNGSINY